MQPLVSVLIPAYNHDKYIQETIESIVNQTYQHIELIIIDDGSTDKTFTIMKILQKKYESHFARFHISSRENKGTCETYNELISLAQGEYILIIASDDKLRPQCIEIEEEFLSKNPDYALCVGNNEFIDSNSNQCYITKYFEPTSDKNTADFRNFASYLMTTQNINFQSEDFGRYNKLIKANFIPNGYLIRKKVFDKILPFTKEAPLEDWWMMLQISKYWKMKYINRILFSYRLHGTNTSWQRQKMYDITEKTYQHEKKILLTLPDEDLSDDAKRIKEYVRLCTQEDKK